jgi:hypothetical protein
MVNNEFLNPYKEKPFWKKKLTYMLRKGKLKSITNDYDMDL